MASKPRKRKGAPAIVPRFLKAAVTIGAIPALAAACHKQQRRTQPVVAAYSQPENLAPDAAVDAPGATPPNVTPPVVAMHVPEKIQPPPPPVVAALVPQNLTPPGPAVVAAYVPRDPKPTPKPPPQKKPKQ